MPPASTPAWGCTWPGWRLGSRWNACSTRLTDIQLVTDDDPHIYGQPFRSPTAIPVTFDAAGVTDGIRQRQRRERGSISVEEILTGAFEVAADVSIDNLSMPVLARHLDVGVTSIYWYFRRKDELLDAMTDRALAQYEFTVPDHRCIELA